MFTSNGIMKGIATAFVLLILSGTAHAQGGPPSMPPAPVEVSKASKQAMSSVVMAPGTVVSRNDARIAAEVSGRLTWVAEVGDRAEKGDVIARIEDRVLQLRLRDNEATVKRLEANLEYMGRQLDRLQKLGATNSAAKDQIDEARSQKTMAEQDLVQARVAREQTLYGIERSQVRAPFSGQIVDRARQAG